MQKCPNLSAKPYPNQQGSCISTLDIIPFTSTDWYAASNVVQNIAIGVFVFLKRTVN